VRGSVGQPGFFSAMYERHLRDVGRDVERQVGSGIAEDLAAEVFVQTFRARDLPD
jgi:DNA-directed RNA polymerase specialized sigma24 family protein